MELLTRAPLGYSYNTPHWGGGSFEPPLLSPKLLDRFSNFKRQSKARQNSDGGTFSHFLSQVNNDVTRGHQRSKGSHERTFTGSAVTLTVLKIEGNVRDQKHSKLIVLTAYCLEILNFLVFDPPKSKKCVFWKNVL